MKLLLQGHCQTVCINITFSDIVLINDLLKNYSVLDEVFLHQNVLEIALKSVKFDFES